MYPSPVAMYSTLPSCHLPKPSCYAPQPGCYAPRPGCYAPPPHPHHPAWCLPAVGEHEEENAKADVADVTEDVVECVERPEGVRTQEVVVTDVLVTRHVQHLPTHKVNRVARSRNTRR